MKRAIGFLVFAGTVGIGVVAEAARPPAGPVCPHFLVKDGNDADYRPDRVQTIPVDGECLLDRDVVDVVQALQLKSGTQLNCQGHLILPSISGQPDDPLTTAFDAVFSQPQLAVFASECHCHPGREVRACSPASNRASFATNR
jgi:hypothetical protein